MRSLSPLAAAIAGHVTLAFSAAAPWCATRYLENTNPSRGVVCSEALDHKFHYDYDYDVGYDYDIPSSPVDVRAWSPDVLHNSPPARWPGDPDVAAAPPTDVGEGQQAVALPDLRPAPEAPRAKAGAGPLLWALGIVTIIALVFISLTPG